MDWREARISAGVNPGWTKIVDDLHAAVLQIEAGVIVEQVKEKFGGLRYYWQLPGDTDDYVRKYAEIDHLVGEAEKEASRTCEVCGQQPAITDAFGQGWLNTLCEEHARIRREVGTPAWRMAQELGT